jgi:UV DNA damage endonuclease
MTTKRVGFACKLIDHPHQINGVGPKDDAKLYNTKTTTISWLNRQTREVAEQRLWDIMVYNIEALRLMVERVSGLEHNLRMCRLSSDILPGYTEPNWSYYYHRGDVRAYLERHFLRLGDLARSRDVRLSFHPGQFCVLASADERIVENSIAEFEYHVDMARYMGYGQRFQDFKINVHIAGRQGPEGIRRALSRLSPEARNTITIENEEITYGLDDCLTISDVCPIVLDIHHNWVREGQYIQPADSRITRIIDSWRGVRPVVHYSVSREDLLGDHRHTELPDLRTLIESGHNKQKLRAHSDFYWNDAVNTWAASHNTWADIMCESKAKNLASFAFYNKYCNHAQLPQETVLLAA